MNKSERKKLAKQILRLCEKQYRKGFQQGFHTCINKDMTKEQVDNFRFKGIDQDYKEVRWPHNGLKENPYSRLLAEAQMSDMDGLIFLLGEFE